MIDKKYVKVMFGNKSGANGFEYKIGEINEAKFWNPSSLNPKEMGGFNFSTEDKILRWLVRGDTIYDVIIPEGSEVIDCPNESAPHGVFRTNKIVITNPRIVTDEMAMEFYKKSHLPEKSYYKAMAGCAVRGYINTANQIFKDKINDDNISLVIKEFEDFCEQPREKLKTLEIYNRLLLFNKSYKISYEDKIPTADEYNNITNEVGWGTRPNEIVEKALNNSLYSICAYDNGKLIGYGRIIGDETIFLYIQDIMVIPKYQSQKVGTNIMKKILEKVEKLRKVNPNIRTYLGATKGKEEFYKKFNFISRKEAGLGEGMILK